MTKIKSLREIQEMVDNTPALIRIASDEEIKDYKNMMNGLEKIMNLPTDNEIELAFENTNFGPDTYTDDGRKRILVDGLEKIIYGYTLGSTLMYITEKLKLQESVELTELGLQFLYKERQYKLESLLLDAIDLLDRVERNEYGELELLDYSDNTWIEKHDEFIELCDGEIRNTNERT